MAARLIGLLAFLIGSGLLIQNLGVQSPLRQIVAGTSPQISIEKHMTDADELFRSASGGDQLAVEFNGFDPADADQGLLMSELYYRAVYALYPARVFAGQDQQLIRDPDELIRARNGLNHNWLAAHGVKNRLEVNRDPQGRIFSICKPID